MDWMPTLANASLISIRSRSADGDALLGQRRAGSRWRRLGLQGVVRAGDDAVRADLGDPGQARAPRPSPCSSRRPRRRRRRSGEADPAVIVPSLANAGRSLASDSAVVSARTPSSSPNDDRVALALRDLDRRDLVGEQAVLVRGGRALVADRAENSSCSSRVMPSGALAFSVGSPIGTSVERVAQPVVGHRVGELGVAVLVARRASSAAGAGRWSSTPCRRRRRCRPRRPGSAGRPARSRPGPTGTPC